MLEQNSRTKKNSLRFCKFKKQQLNKLILIANDGDLDLNQQTGVKQFKNTQSELLL